MKAIADVPIPDAYLIEIGRVSVTWSFLESIVDLCLMKLSGKDINEGRSWAIFAHMTFPLKLDVLSTLVSVLQPNYPGLARYPEIRDLLKESQQRRNLIVHSKWGLDPETAEVQVSNLSARGTLKTSVRAVSVEEIRETSKVIGKASVELFKLVVSSSDASSWFNPGDSR